MSTISSAVAYWESKAADAVALAGRAAHVRMHAPKHDRVGRKPPGPPSAVTTLTAEEQIRADRAAGATLPTLALRYRTSYRRLYRILGS